MATIQLEIPEEERERFAKQAELEGMSLDTWLLSLARRSVGEPSPAEAGEPSESDEELWAFLREHSGLDGPERELDWEEHLRNMDASIRKGLPDV
jgi:hypothetical protein